MLNLETYLKDVEDKIEKTGRVRESKREKEILELVKGLIEKKEPTTIKTIQRELNISKPQQIHQIVKKSKLLRKEKIKGFTLIVPVEMEVEEAPKEEVTE